MYSIKNVGKIKEQLELEDKARRNYPKKWLNSNIKTVWHRLYNQDELSKQLREQSQLKDFCPYIYTGEGDSYFVSRDMYKSLKAHCRCGRLRSDLHLLKCLQKSIDSQSQMLDDEKAKCLSESKKDGPLNIPLTSNSIYGWPDTEPIYKKWEKSMKHISPLYTMPGPRIDEKPYNVIMIG